MRPAAVFLPTGPGWQTVLMRRLTCIRAARGAAGLAGRAWLLEHQNYETLARDYLQKIEACVVARP